MAVGDVGTRVYVEKRDYDDKVAIFIAEVIIDDRGGKVRQVLRFVDGKPEFVKTSPGVDVKPSILLDSYTAQVLVNELAGAGISPKKESVIEGKYEAQCEHLKDLQAILRKKGVM